MVEANPQPAGEAVSGQNEEYKTTVALIDRVLDKIEDFYFEEGESSGKALFAAFAADHHHIFEDNVNSQEMEQKLE